MSAPQSVRFGNKIAKHSAAWHTYMEQKADDAAWQQLPFAAIARFNDELFEWRMCRICGQYLQRAVTSVTAAYAPRARRRKRQAKERPRPTSRQPR